MSIEGALRGSPASGTGGRDGAGAKVTRYCRSWVVEAVGALGFNGLALTAVEGANGGGGGVVGARVVERDGEDEAWAKILCFGSS